jgi:hypothetical protein
MRRKAKGPQPKPPWRVEISWQRIVVEVPAKRDEPDDADEPAQSFNVTNRHQRHRPAASGQYGGTELSRPDQLGARAFGLKRSLVSGKAPHRVDRYQLAPDEIRGKSKPDVQNVRRI